MFLPYIDVIPLIIILTFRLLTARGTDKPMNYKEKILEYWGKYAESRTQDSSLYIGLKFSRTKDYLSELVEEGKIIANGANKNRTYSLKSRE